MSWKDDKDLGPWTFNKQPNKWGYLNNPRWQPQPVDPVSYTGNELNEPQEFTPLEGNTVSQKYGEDKHNPCGHWHSRLIAPPGTILYTSLGMNGGETQDFDVDGPGSNYSWGASDGTIDTITGEFTAPTDPNLDCEAITIYLYSDGVLVDTLQIMVNTYTADPNHIAYDYIELLSGCFTFFTGFPPTEKRGWQIGCTHYNCNGNWLAGPCNCVASVTFTGDEAESCNLAFNANCCHVTCFYAVCCGSPSNTGNIDVRGTCPACAPANSGCCPPALYF